MPLLYKKIQNMSMKVSRCENYNQCIYMTKEYYSDWYFFKIPNNSTPQNHNEIILYVRKYKEIKSIMMK